MTDNAFPATYGLVMGPLVIDKLSEETQQMYRADATFRDWVHLYDQVMRAEKISSWAQWTPEQTAAYQAGDYVLFSRLRGYTEQEIEDFERHLDLIRTLDQTHEVDFCRQFIYEIQEAVRTPAFDEVEARILAMHHDALRQEAAGRARDL